MIDKIKHPEKRKGRVCYNCRYKTGEEYDFLFKFDKKRRTVVPRVVIQKMCLNMMFCPKCGATYPVRGFIVKNAEQTKRQRRRRKRVQQLRKAFLV